MRPAEQGFLLLTASLGDPHRMPLTVAQLRVLASRVRDMERAPEERDLTETDLRMLGYDASFARRILNLLSQEELLQLYLRKAERAGCVPVTRITQGYPAHLRQRLGLDSPGCLWAKGDLSLLDMPMVSLVGSREIEADNRGFAWEVGVQAARQGYVLVSGNARGADRIAQSACLRGGGKVISVLADELDAREREENVLYLSEDDFNAPFSAQRALSRNRVIHALGWKTFVAQCSHKTGGTWDGTVKNLRFGWSSVFCFDDGSVAAQQLEQMGAKCITRDRLGDFESLQTDSVSLFDQ